MPLKDCLTGLKQFKKEEIDYYLAQKDKYLKKGLSEREAELRVVGEAIDNVNNNMKSVYDQLGMKVPDTTKDLSEKLPALSQRLAGMSAEDVREALKKNTNLDEAYIDALISGIPKAKKAEVSADTILAALDANKDSFQGPLGEMIAEKLGDSGERADIVEMVKAQVNDDPELAVKVYGEDLVNAVLGKESKTQNNERQSKKTEDKTVLSKKEGETPSSSKRSEFLDKLNNKSTGDFALFTKLPKEKKRQKLDAISSKIDKAWKDGIISDDDYQSLTDRLNADYAQLGIEKTPKVEMTEAPVETNPEPVKKDVVEPKKEAPKKKPRAPKLTRQERINKLVDMATAYTKERDKTKKAQMLNEIKLEANKLGGLKIDAAKGYAIVRYESGNKVKKKETVTNNTEAKDFDTASYSDKTNKVVDAFKGELGVEYLPDVVGTDGRSLSMAQKKNLLEAIKSGKVTEGVKALYDTFEKMIKSGYIDFKDTGTGQVIGVPVDEYLESISKPVEPITDTELDDYAIMSGGWEKIEDDIFETINEEVYESDQEENFRQIEPSESDFGNQDTQEYQAQDGNTITGEQAQETIEQKNVKAMLDNAASELKAATDAMKAKRAELEKGFQADQSDLFGERKTGNALFDVRADGEAIQKTMKPFQDRVEKAKQEVDRLSKKLQEVSGKPSSQLDMLAKLGSTQQSEGTVSERFGEDVEASFNEVKKYFEGDEFMTKAIAFVRKLVGAAGKVKVEMLENFDNDPRIPKSFKMALGLAMPDGTLLLNYSLLKNDPVEAYTTFVHEMVHAVTRREINTNSALRQELDSLAEELKDALGLPSTEQVFDTLFSMGLINKDLYGTKNAHELIAEIFSNKNFYEYLKKVQYKGDSFVTRIIQKILSFFNKNYKALLHLKSQIDVDNVADYLVALSDRFFSGQQSETGNILPMLSQNVSQESSVFAMAAGMIEAGASIDEAINATVESLAAEMQGEGFQKRELKRIVTNRFKEIGLISEDKSVNYVKAIQSLFPKPNLKGIKQAFREATRAMNKGAKEAKANQKFITDYLKENGVELTKKRMDKVMSIVNSTAEVLNSGDKMYKALEQIDAIIQDQVNEDTAIREQEDTKRVSDAIKQKFKDRFMKEKAMKQGARNQASLTKELIGLATAYFKANGVDLTKGRVASLLKQVSRLAGVDAPVDMLEGFTDAMDAIVLQQKNQNNLKAAKDAMKKIKKVAKGSNVQEVDANFLRALNFPSAMKVLRMLGPAKLAEYVNILSSVGLAYSTKQGVRMMAKDRVKWFVDTLNQELSGAEQEKFEKLLQAAKDAGEVAQDATLDEYLPMIAQNQKEGLNDYLKSVIKELQDALGTDYGDNTSVAKELKGLNLDNFDSDGLKKLNNILNNIINDDDFDGSEAILAKYKDANNALTELEKPSNGLKIRQLNAWKDWFQSVPDLKTMSNMITSLFYDDKARAKFRELIFGKLDQSLSKPRAEVNELAKKVSDMYKALKLNGLSDYKLSAYAFLNQYLNDHEQEFGLRLEKLINDNIISMYNIGTMKGKSPNKKIFMKSATSLAEALKSMGLIEGYSVTENGMEVQRKADVNFTDLRYALTDNEMKVYNFARSKFDEQVDASERTARNVYGLDFTRWNNYFPMIARKLKDPDVATGNLETVQDNFEIFGDIPTKMSKKPTDRFKERGKLAGADKYYQMGFMDMFLNGYSQTVVSNSAGRSLVALAGVANSDRFGKFLSGAMNEIVAGTKDDFQENKRVFREKMADVVADKLQAPFLFRSRDEGIKRFMRSTMNFVVKSWLARIDQFTLQYVPNWAAAAVETGVPAMSFATKLQIESVYDKDLRSKYDQFLQNFTGQFRSAMGMEAFDETMQNLDEPGALTTAKKILNIPNMPGSYALHTADKGANNVTLIAAYVKYLVDNGMIKSPFDFDIDSHIQFPNPGALAYAEHISARVNNESDKANRANVIKNKNGSAGTFMWLLKGYNLNAYQEAASNMKVVLDKRSSGSEKAEAMRHVMSYLTQITVFNSLKAAVLAPAYVALADYILPAVLGVEPPEEDEETKKANSEKKRVKFVASLLADISLGGLPQVGEIAAKKGANLLYKEAMEQIRGEEKTGMYDPKLSPYYVSSEDIGSTALLTDAGEKVVDAFTEEKNSKITEEARKAKDKVDIAQLVALVLRSGDLLRLTGTVDAELNKIKKEKKKKGSSFGPKFSSGFGKKF